MSFYQALPVLIIGVFIGAGLGYQACKLVYDAIRKARQKYIEALEMMNHYLLHELMPELIKKIEDKQ